MGCCVCRPATEVTDDPEVVVCTEVSNYAMLYHSGGSVRSQASGLLYIKHDQLCYQATVGSKLCCGCCSNSWQLSRVKQVRAVQAQYVRVPLSNRVIFLNPGVIIGIENGRGDTNSLVAAMPDAANFSAQLGQYISSPGSLPGSAH